MRSSNQKIRRGFLERGETTGAVKGSIDLKAFICKVIADEFDDVAIVFNDQDALHGQHLAPQIASIGVYRRASNRGRHGFVLTPRHIV